MLAALLLLVTGASGAFDTCCCGRWTPVEPPNAETVKLLQTLKGQAESGVGPGVIFAEFTVLSYLEQIVAGTNYNATVRVNINTCIQIQVNEALGEEPRLSLYGVQDPVPCGCGKTRTCTCSQIITPRMGICAAKSHPPIIGWIHPSSSFGCEDGCECYCSPLCDLPVDIAINGGSADGNNNGANEDEPIMVGGCSPAICQPIPFKSVGICNDQQPDGNWTRIGDENTCQSGVFQNECRCYTSAECGGSECTYVQIWPPLEVKGICAPNGSPIPEKFTLRESGEGCGWGCDCYTPPIPSIGSCGHSTRFDERTVTDKIANGQPAITGMWPWMVHFNYFSSFLEINLSCAGTLIAKRWVLSAAHCFRFLEPNIDVYVKIGFVNLKRQEQGSDLFSITKNNIITHDEFSATTLENDIALVHLPAEVTLSRRIQIICLGTNQNIPFGATAWAAGWGLHKPSDRDIPNILHNEELDVLPDNSCKTKSPQHFICTFTPGKDTCLGDSGGPLMVQQGSQWYQIGIVSHGPTDCGTHNSPGVYTRVPNYLAFIASIISF